MSTTFFVTCGLLLLCVMLDRAVAASSPPHRARRPPRWFELDDSSAPPYTFDDYCRDFKKPYPAGSTEYAMRETVFRQALGEIIHHNRYSGSTYRQGVNRFTDWLPEELAQLTPTFPVEKPLAGDGAVSFEEYAEGKKTRHERLPQLDADARDHVDWRSVTPPVLSAVKDQGYCGSCWAFGSTATLESQWALATNELWDLSPQQLVSCVPTHVVGNDSMGGCNGMFPSHAYDYMLSSSGLTQSFVYPYGSYFVGNGTNDNSRPTCDHWLSSFARTPITGAVETTRNDAVEVARALASSGPMTAVMYVPNSFFRYESGIFRNATCESNSMQPSHVVQLIGYGHDASLGADYWLLRNSWSPLWGEEGYFRLYKTVPAICGNMVWPVDGNWGNVTACGECGVLLNNMFPIPNV